MLSRWFGRKAKVAGQIASPALAASLPAGLRIYAIGDIHGKRRLLQSLHAIILADNATCVPAKTRLVYLGDYIDRGEDSRGVIEDLINPDPLLPPAIHLRGNHEQTLLDCLDDPTRLDEWCGFGGLETMLSYGVEAGLLRSRTNPAATIAAFAVAVHPHLAFYEKLDYSVEFGDYFFCHAGVRPGISLVQQSPSDLMWIRGEFLSANASFGRMIVHGHTPVDQPECHHNRINIDTGAYATRILTAAVLEGTDVRFLQT